MTRETVWKGSRLRGANWVRLTCNACGKFIREEPYDRSDYWTLEYSDENRGHECAKCRKKRERMYDARVTSPERS